MRTHHSSLNATIASGGESSRDLDQMLFERLQQNDFAAHLEFLRQWVAKFEWHARRIGFTQADAKDCATTAATHTLMRLLEQEQKPDRLDAWIWVVGRNKLEDERRLLHPNLLQPLRDWDAAQREDAESDPAAMPAHMTTIREAIQQLGPQDRELIRFRYECDYSFSDIAAELQISEGAARVRHHRTLRRLHTILREALPIDDIMRSR